MLGKSKYVLFFGLLTATAVAVAIALMLRSGPARARLSVQEVFLGAITSAGTGCPAGTAQAFLDLNQRRILLALDSYEAETGPGDAFARASCNISMPLSVSSGMRISVRRIDYHGSASIPPGGSGSIMSESFFAGVRGATLNRTFPSGYDDELHLTDTGASLWSGCGEDVLLRINSSVSVSKASPDAPEEGRIGLRRGSIRNPSIAFELAFDDC